MRTIYVTVKYNNHIYFFKTKCLFNLSTFSSTWTSISISFTFNFVLPMFERILANFQWPWIYIGLLSISLLLLSTLRRLVCRTDYCTRVREKRENENKCISQISMFNNISFSFHSISDFLPFKLSCRSNPSYTGYMYLFYVYFIIPCIRVWFLNFVDLLRKFKKNS